MRTLLYDRLSVYFPTLWLRICDTNRVPNLIKCHKWSVSFFVKLFLFLDQSFADSFCHISRILHWKRSTQGSNKMVVNDLLDLRSTSNTSFWLLFFLKKWPTTASFCLFSFFSNTNFYWNRIWARIVGIEGKQADHLTTPCLRLMRHNFTLFAWIQSVAILMPIFTWMMQSVMILFALLWKALCLLWCNLPLLFCSSFSSSFTPSTALATMYF